MRVLVGCEESQEVTKAFRALGYEAYSCDLQECSGGHPEWHIQDDLLNILNDSWDLVVAHPPCTYFANAGLHYLKTRPERMSQLETAFSFTIKIWNSPVSYVAIENPIGWLNTNWMKPAQIIQPYYFGDRELKTTCLWLRGLPALEYRSTPSLFGERTTVDRPQPVGYCVRKTGINAGKKYNYYWRQGKSAKRRSKTFPGIAKAMAEQWGSYVSEQLKKKSA